MLRNIEAPKKFCFQAAWTSDPSSSPPKEWPQEGKVEFKNYTTRYREGLDLALNDVSAKIQPGQKVGIVGRTGAGMLTSDALN